VPVVITSVTSSLPPDEVLRILTDFGPARAAAFPGVDDASLTVHDRGDTWADVTEGNKIGWERERYEWDQEARSISAVTTESNLWAPGSRWDYRLLPQDGGTRVVIRLERHGKSALGKVIGAAIPLIGKRMITTVFSRALEKRPSS
jgi:hypothetical protein